MSTQTPMRSRGSPLGGAGREETGEGECQSVNQTHIGITGSGGGWGGWGMSISPGAKGKKQPKLRLLKNKNRPMELAYEPPVAKKERKGDVLSNSSPAGQPGAVASYTDRQGVGLTTTVQVKALSSGAPHPLCKLIF